VVLLDEIEKAHPDIFNLLLQVLDDGHLTDSNGRVVNFKNTIVIMTSNVGSRELEEYGSGVGFATAGKNVTQNRQSVLEKAIKKSFPPESINRVDEQVFFNTLTRDDIEQIIDIELKDLRERTAEAGYKLTITPSAKKFIADAGYDPAFGARPLKRAVMRYVEDPVSEFIISDRILQGKEKRDSAELRTLRVGLTTDKENTLVTLKEPEPVRS
jgi:ATP-dependent Clp protease ATP-binding subunit ClpC